jgi:L-ribulose-5-phosphate 3-epimerase
MIITRRAFLTQTGAAISGAALINSLPAAASGRGGKSKIKFGACVVGFEPARQAGLDGIEVGVGDAADRLHIADPEVRRQHKEQARQTGVPVCSLMMGLLNSYPLATDPRGPAWLDQSIDAAHDLGARVILVAFFGKGDLLDNNGQVKTSDVDVVVQRIKDAAPKAKKAGVILGIENYLNAEQNARILDRISHDSVKLYYDVYNTGATKGYDVPSEIRFLKDRIAQFHFKNGPDYLDKGQVKFEPIAAAIKDIAYRGWIVLETSSPSKDATADVKRNADYARKLFA